MANGRSSLKIVNGFLRDRVVRAKSAVSGDRRREQAARRQGSRRLRPARRTDRAKAVARTIGVSLDLLSEPNARASVSLASFPRTRKSLSASLRVCGRDGGLEDFETEDLLSRLFDLSLLLDLDLGQRFFRLHDTTRHFLRDWVGRRASPGNTSSLSRRSGLEIAEADVRTRRYYYLGLPYHLAEAGARERLDGLLLDPGWLKAKLEATANPQALVADYERYGVGEAQSLIGRTLRVISGICARDPRQLPLQLAERLGGGSGRRNRLCRKSAPAHHSSSDRPSPTYSYHPWAREYPPRGTYFHRGGCLPLTRRADCLRLF